MPPNRRLKAVLLLAAVLFLLALYITSSAGQTRSSQFYTKTQDALAQARAAKEAGLSDSEVATGEDDTISQRLRKAEEDAKRQADEKGDAFHGDEFKQQALKMKEVLELAVSDQTAPDSKHEGSAAGEKAVAGRKIMKGESETSLKAANKEIVADAGANAKKTPEDAPKDKKDDEAAHTELNDILKKSPLIIFSKSYCPYSKRAKHILLDKYKITPEPYVVELDLHPIGPQLQAYLGDITGRRTVPNVLIQAKSIGGGDDVQALDDGGTLIDTVQRMGGKRVTIERVSDGK